MGPAASIPDLDRLSPSEERAWRALARAHSCLVKRLDARLEEAHGLPLTSYEVLLKLAATDGGKLRMHDIASSVLLSRSGLTRLVDRLVALGYVRRNTCADDGRGSYAELTEAGATKLQDARRTHLAGVREFFLERLGDEDRRALGDAWEKVLLPSEHLRLPA